MKYLNFFGHKKMIFAGC